MPGTYLDSGEGQQWKIRADTQAHVILFGDDGARKRGSPEENCSPRVLG